MIKKKKAIALCLSLSLMISPLAGNVQAAAAETNQPALGAAVNSDAPGNLALEQTNGGMALTWDSYNNAASYDVYRAKSRYGNYTKLATVNGLSYTDTVPDADKYANYYKVAVAGSDKMSDPISLEIEMFGEDMYVFSPEDDIEQVFQAVNDVYRVQGSVEVDADGKEGDASTGQQFGTGRYTFAFKTGDYSKMEATQFNMSYYMQLIGLGKVPTDVKIRNIHVPPVLPDWNVTCNFWMDVENLSIYPEEGTTDQWFNFMWSVSQAAPARRLYVNRPTTFHYMWDGWASGGFVADSVFDSQIVAYTQQQYYIRNSELNGGFTGVNWNFVTQGTTGVKLSDEDSAKFPLYDLKSGEGKTNWESGGKYTLLDKTDVIREKPFLYFDEDTKEYKVFVPALRKNSVGVTWTKNDMGDGVSVDIGNFYIARADRDNAATINAALAAGKNLILSPGIYYVEEPLKIDRANTIVLGLGLATVIPKNEDAAIKVADVGGVTISGVILDAASHSRNMLVVGEEGCNKSHASNPTVLHDLFVRIGGVYQGVASTEQAVVINSNDVIGDDFWIWRADHGDGVGWDLNKAKNGVVVNGDNVSLHGLMVEHFQEYDIIWRGENGKTYFLQNEKCYDPQNQADWMSHDGTVLGYSAYKVTNNVKNHYAVGLGSYDVFINTNGASIYMDNAFEVPDTEGVMIENACIVEIANGEGPPVGFNHIVNSTGPAITTGAGLGKGYARQALLYYSNNKSLSLKDSYETGEDNREVGIEEAGTAPTDDKDAEKDIVKDPPSVDKNEENLFDELENLNGGGSKVDYKPNIGEGSVATGPYAAWKNNAVTYPAKGQLVASGMMDIKFNRLPEAVKYDVYVDNMRVKTFEGNDAKAESFTVETKNVSVKGHTTYIVATLGNGKEVVSNIRTFYISKKGMGIWQDDVDKIKETNLSWYYTWSPKPLTGVSEQVEFVPMIWGDEADNRSQDRKDEWAWLRNGGYKDYRYLLTFNEPDFTDQSHMTPERAVELWPEIEKISDEGTIVSSPVVAIPTVFYDSADNDYGTVGGWYGKYEQLMATAEYHDDFTAVHFYFDYPGDYVLDVIDQIHEKTGKPIWITEWGVGQWSQVQDFDWTGGPDEGNWQREIIVDFVNKIIPKLDKIDYVERYAWFPFDGSNTEKYGNGAGGLFFASGDNNTVKGELTSVGKAYKEVGNPVGWDPENPTDDMVVLDDMETEDPSESSSENTSENGSENPGEAPSEIHVANVTLDQTSLEIETGQYKRLHATVEPNSASNKGVTWTSDNPEIATVTGDGLVYGVKTGETTITVKTDDGNKTAKCKVTVKEAETIRVEDVTLNLNDITLEVGMSDRLEAIVLPVNAANKNVTWTSSDISVADVEEYGDASVIVTAYKEGTATITVTTEDGEKTAECTVTVTARSGETVSVENMKLDKTEVTLKEGELGKINAVFTPANATNQGVFYRTSNQEVVFVSSTGDLMARKAGKATITARAADGGYAATCEVTVLPIETTGITLNKTTLALEEGMSERLVASVIPSNASDQEVRWTSSDNTIAKVDENGVVTAVKAGTAVVTAETGNAENGIFKETCQVTITERAPGNVPVSEISLNKEELSVVEGELDDTLKASITPENASNQNIIWRSSDLNIAVVTGDGIVYARKAGTAVITAIAADGMKEATCVVTVTEREAGAVAVTGVKLDTNMAELKKGETKQLTASVLPENATNQKVTFQSTDESIVTVSETGLVTAVGSGMAAIVVLTADGGYQTVCAVRVKEDAASVEPGKDPDTKPTPDPKPTPTPTPEQGLTAGTVFESGKLKYMIINAAENDLQVGVVSPLKKTEKTITIPATVTYSGKTLKVTAIGNKAFKGSSKLKSVTIGQNVVSIGSQAFIGCKKLTKVKMGKSVAAIGSKAFYNCKKLKLVTFKNKKAPKISSKAFSKTSRSIVFRTGNKKTVSKYKKALRKKMPVTARVKK